MVVQIGFGQMKKKFKKGQAMASLGVSTQGQRS
jgi:hypothetical protein